MEELLFCSIKIFAGVCGSESLQGKADFFLLITEEKPGVRPIHSITHTYTNMSADKV